MQDDELARMMRALGHPARLRILRILAKNSQNCCCADVTESLPLAQSTVSQHIKVLFNAGLIECQVKGTRNCYVVVPAKLAAIQSAWCGLAAGLCTSNGENISPEISG